MSPDLPDVSRNSVRMLGGRYRVVPSATEVKHYLALSARRFPDGREVVSISLTGVWTCTMTSSPFEVWSRGVLHYLKENVDYFVCGDSRNDIIVDAQHIIQIVTNSASRRGRAMIDFTTSAIIAAEVDRQVSLRLLAILDTADEETRERLLAFASADNRGDVAPHAYCTVASS